MFATEADHRNERAVAAELSEKFGCEVRCFGGRDEVDMYAVRNGRMSAIIELKTRKIHSTKHATVFLAMRKYLDMTRIGAAFAVPAIFVVKYEDCTKYINLSDVDTSRHTMGGNSRNKAYNDIEPLIEVPVTQMVAL